METNIIGTKDVDIINQIVSEYEETELKNNDLITRRGESSFQDLLSKGKSFSCLLYTSDAADE